MRYSLCIKYSKKHIGQHYSGTVFIFTERNPGDAAR